MSTPEFGKTESQTMRAVRGTTHGAFIAGLGYLLYVLIQAINHFGQ